MSIRSFLAPATIALVGGALALSACSKAPEAAAKADPVAAAPAPAMADMPAGHDHEAMMAAAAQAGPAAQQAAAQPVAATPVKMMTVADFTLKDASGKTHQLYKLTDKAAIVIAMQGVGCPIVLKMTPDIKAAAAKYGAKNVEFLMLNSNPQDTPEMIAAEAKDFDQPIPILKDADQKVGKALGAKRTAEMYVIQPKTWQVLYHGPIDDRLSYGQEKAVATKHYLSDALDEVLAGKPVTVEQTQANGCLINFS